MSNAGETAPVKMQAKYVQAEDVLAQEIISINENLIQRIINVIEQASNNGVSKRKVLKFLKQQPGIADSDIYMAYTRYYQKHVCVKFVTIINYTTIRYIHIASMTLNIVKHSRN